MKKLLASISALTVSSLLAVACGNDGSAKPDPAGTGAQPPAPRPQATGATPGGGQFAASPAQTGSPATPAPTSGKGYPRDGLRTIPDSCASPLALLATAPGSVGDDYAWPISRQALLANQQFKVVSGDPTVPGEVQLSTYKYNNTAYALVARCKDGGTCNDVAAMYKGIVRSSNPQLVCGKLNGLSSAPVGRGFGWAGDPKQNLPTDVVGKCARLNACMIATDRSTPGDPFLECQKAPMKFKTECADRYPCAEVLACTGR